MVGNKESKTYKDEKEKKQNKPRGEEAYHTALEGKKSAMDRANGPEPKRSVFSK